MVLTANRNMSSSRSEMKEEFRATESFLPRIRYCLKFSGDLTGGKEHVSIEYLLRRYALHALRMFIVMQSALVPLFYWKTWDLELRVTWLEEFSCEFTSLLFAMNFYYSKANTQGVMNLIRPIMFYIDGNEDNLQKLVLSEKAIDMVEREDVASLKLLKFVKTFVNIANTTYAVKPIFRTLLHWLGAQPLDAAALPFMCFNPFVHPLSPDVSKITHLIILTLPQLIYLYDNDMGHEVVYVGLFQCIGNVVTDMKVLIYELGEMKILLEQQSLTDEEDSMNFCRDLQRILRQIVFHHQIVFRKVKAINKLYTFPILFLNGYCCIYICLGVYCVVNGDSTTIITHCVPTIMMVFLCHIFCENGQRIETEGENLRMALYNCYVGCRQVPLWYHRSIFMLLLRHSRPPNLGPFRIFCLNRVNLKVIMQGAMSYFNIINNLAK